MDDIVTYGIFLAIATIRDGTGGIFAASLRLVGYRGVWQAYRVHNSSNAASLAQLGDRDPLCWHNRFLGDYMII